MKRNTAKKLAESEIRDSLRRLEGLGLIERCDKDALENNGIRAAPEAAQAKCREEMRERRRKTMSAISLVISGAAVLLSLIGLTVTWLR